MRLFTLVGYLAPIWEEWIEIHTYPPVPECQNDNWSCGLFTVMAMDAFTQNAGFDDVLDCNKDAMRVSLFWALKELP